MTKAKTSHLKSGRALLSKCEVRFGNSVPPAPPKPLRKVSQQEFIEDLLVPRG